MTYISNVSFEEADIVKTIATFDDIELPIIHYTHLINSKISSERLKDRADERNYKK